MPHTKSMKYYVNIFYGGANILKACHATSMFFSNKSMQDLNEIVTQFISGDSDTDNDLYQPQVEDDEDYDDENDDGDDDDDDDDDDYIEGQLVVDEKTPTQSLYMMEKSKKKLVIKDGKVVGTTKAQRKDKGKARYNIVVLIINGEYFL